MRNIFIGVLLTFLNFRLNIGDCIIGIIPNFVAYAYMVKGIDELENESQIILNMRKFAVGMIVYSSILYALDLFKISANFILLSNILKLISTMIGFYISYYIIKGIKEIEKIHSVDLQGETLRLKWDIMVFSIIASCIFALALIPIIFIILVIITVITTTIFLVAFNKTTKLYEELQLQPSNNID